MCFIISFNIPSGPDAFLSWRFLIFSVSSLSVIGKSNGFWLSLIVNSSFSNWLIVWFAYSCVCLYFIKQCLEMTFPYFSILYWQFFMNQFFSDCSNYPKIGLCSLTSRLLSVVFGCIVLFWF